MNKLLKNIILHCPARTCPAKFPEICPISFPFPCPSIEPIENNTTTVTSIAKKCTSCNKNHKNKTHKNIIKT